MGGKKAGKESMSLVQRAFDDLSTRFVKYCPEEELMSFERLFFQLEQAHWYYEDFLRENETRLPHYNLKVAFIFSFFLLFSNSFVFAGLLQCVLHTLHTSPGPV